ncbi:MAG TPA: rhamnogalacturonan acetylesterase [Phycisphaerae bacterium]|nr:rhamnogalacturonan acetylesterase [Phycisphaerae bacterium]
MKKLFAPVALMAGLVAMAAAQTQPAGSSSAPAGTSSQPAAGRAGRGAAVARTGVLAPDHNPALPTVFLIGDSTVKNSWDRGTDGLWGWGHPLAAFFDTSKINVDNQALGGTSSHSYQTANWPGVLALVKKGDFVLMQFGTNDNGAASGRGNGDEVTAGRGGDVHTFGWYMRKYCEDVKAKGATPIICSLVPRRGWTDGKARRDTATHAGWAKEAAAQEKVGFIDLNDLIATRYEKIGPEATQNLFGKSMQSGAIETVHTNWYGAILNAECVVEGIRKMPECELNKYLLEKPAVEKLKKPSTDPTPDPAPLPDVMPGAASAPGK